MPVIVLNGFSNHFFPTFFCYVYHIFRYCPYCISKREPAEVKEKDISDSMDINQ